MIDGSSKETPATLPAPTASSVAGERARKGTLEAARAHPLPVAPALSAKAIKASYARRGSADAGSPCAPISLWIDSLAIGRGSVLVLALGELEAEAFAALVSGHPRARLEAGSLHLRGTAIEAMSPSERSLAGLFVSHPPHPSIKGLAPLAILRAATDAHRAAQGLHPADPIAYTRDLRIIARRLGLAAAALSAPVPPPGTSERFRMELLTMEVLQPAVAVLGAPAAPDDLAVLAGSLEVMRSPERAFLILADVARASDVAVACAAAAVLRLSRLGEAHD